MTGEVSEFEIISGLAERVKLPPQPKVLLAINEEIKKEQPSFERIAGLIEQDPAMTAKVLKIVNSPFYRTSSNELTTMIQALSILGLRNFVCVVLASCLKDAVGITDATNRLWDHALLVARIGQLIANKTRAVTPEAAYMAGLFHDISVPLLLDKEPRFKELMEMLVVCGGNIEAFEEDNFDTSHSVMSYLMARSWQLPDTVCDAIHMHHCNDFSVFPSNESRRLAAVLMLADHLAREMANKNANQSLEDSYWQKIEAQVLEEIGNCDAEGLEELRVKAAELGEAA